MSATHAMSKSALVQRATAQMQQHLTMPAWTVAEKVVLAARVLYAQGHDSGLAGQITARVDGTSTFVTQRMGVGFDEAAAANLLVVNEDLDVLQGSGMPSPANRFHAWIYRERPEVQCIVHTHPLHIAALSMLGCRLEIAHMDSCVLYDDVAFLDDWPGVPVGNNEGELISDALGTRRAVLLAHHGLLVACGSVEEACVVATQCERAATLQLLAASAGTIQKIDPALGREAHDWLLQEKRVQATFYYFARKILQQFPGCLDSPAKPERS